MITSVLLNEQVCIDHGLHVQLPERSRVFQLPPIADGREQQESLISLMIRTSRAHSLNPRKFIGVLFKEAVPEIHELNYPTFYNRLSGTINGLGQYAQLFVSAMEKLTGHQKLCRLTWLPWKDFFPRNGQGALAKHPRWCSTCLLERSQRGEETYFPLLWSMQTYRICTIHSQVLDECCPHCGKRQPFFSRYPDQSICHHCLKSLIPNYVGRNIEDSLTRIFEMWIAKALGQMLAKNSDPEFSPSLNHFHKNMKILVDSWAGGNRAAFCRALGLNEFALKNWLIKGERPSLPQFLTISYALQIPTVELISNRINLTGINVRLTAPFKLKERRKRVTTFKTHTELSDYLEKLLKTDKPKPVTEIANNLNLSPGYLRYWFPRLCEKLSKHWKKSLNRICEKKKGVQQRRVEEIVRRFKNEKQYPSRRKVDAILRKEGMSLGMRFLYRSYQKAK